MDFKFDNGDGIDNSAALQGKDQDGQKFDENGNLIPDLNGGNNGNDNHDDDDDANKNKDNNNGDNHDDDNKNKDNNDDNKNNDIKLEEGQQIEITVNDEVVTYTVDKDGNLIDKDGNIFKEAKDVQEYLKDFETSKDDDKNVINLDNIQTKLGIEITDAEGKKVEYNNDIEGLSSYINDVIENQKEDVAKAAVAGVFDKYPILNDVLNYYVANGNSLDGFGQLKDRSNVEIKEDNEQQQEYIIRTAWNEQKRSGDVESYIAWLKNSGTLYATAKAELEGLQASDKAAREEIAKKAKETEEANKEQMRQYWVGVQDVIKSRKIADYTIPESIIVQKDGKKVAKTPDDFFKYLFEVDKNGNSRYANDLLKLTPEERRNNEILNAYLTFTGGSYADLVKMAINEERVKTIKLNAKNAEKRTIKITTKTNLNNKNDVDLGY